jgi:hypothetical protein
MSAPPPNRDERFQLLFVAVFCPAALVLVFVATFFEPKGPSMMADLWWAFHNLPPWLVWLTRVILAALVVNQYQVISRPMLREFWRRGRETPDAAPGDPLERETVAELWIGIIVMPVFGGMIASVPLAGTSTDGGAWGTLWVVLAVGGFFMFGALVMGVLRLEELRRRGAWVPPGTDRHPVLVPFALALLIMTAAGAFMHVGRWLVQLWGEAS